MTSEDAVEACRTAAALYSLGALTPDESAKFEQRLRSGCPFCTSEMEAYGAVADEISVGIATCPPDAAVRERVIERIGVAASTSLPNGDMKLVRGDSSPWTPLPIPGVEVRPLLGEKTLLVRMQPGAVYPAHEHRYAEQCYVLEGTVTDSTGVTAFAGDFVCMAAGSKHGEIQTKTGCVFLLAYTA
jgi:anti-sigma factor ChrR (cupin superfamily)